MSARYVLGCSLATLLAIAVFTVVVEHEGLKFMSPLSIVDPSDGGDDPLLADGLRRALVEQPSAPLEFIPGSAQILDVPNMDFAEFKKRLRRVPGWDLIAVLAPSGAELVAQDPRITSWWLRRRIAGRWNVYMDIFQYQLLVVRDDRLVTWFSIRFTGGGVEDIITAIDADLAPHPSAR